MTNRGNDRRVIFHEDADYQRFLKLVASARDEHSVDVIAYCPMPNHFHLILRPPSARALSAYMKCVEGGYACDYRWRTETVGHGHVFQNRFWNTPITSDEHFLTTLRYVEANPLRAGLVRRAQDWRWSSLRERSNGSPSALLSSSPVPLPSYWPEIVNIPQTAEALNRIRGELVRQRGRPKRD